MQDDEFPGKHEIFEKRVMDSLLIGDHELFARLRRQYESATVTDRDFDGYGFFTGFAVNDVSASVYNKFFTINDTLKYDGVEGSFGITLFIKKGLIDFLEGYPYISHSWIEDYDKVGDVFYNLEPEIWAQEDDVIRRTKGIIRRNMPGLRWEPKTGPLALKFEPKDETYLEKHEIFEKKLMDMLLFGDNELFARLRKQYESALVIRRGFDRSGFITNFEVGDRSLAIADRSFILGDIRIESSSADQSYDVTLFIDDGLISCLVGCPSFVNNWIDYHSDDVRMYYAADGDSDERDPEYIKRKFEENMG